MRERLTASTTPIRGAAFVAVAPPPLDALPGDRLRLAWAFLEDVVAELARSPTLEVLAGRTSFSLTPEELAPNRLAERFGVTHVLDVGLRPMGEGLRVRSTLTDAATSRQLWTHADDVLLPDLQSASEEIAARVANQLSSRLDGARLLDARRRPIASLEAYELWLRGWDVMRRGGPAGDETAREHFERALELDPGFARACVGLALTHFNNWSSQFWTQGDEAERRAYDYAQRAVELDDRDHLPHIALARMEIYRRNAAPARRHLERVLSLCPSNAEALVQTSLWWGYLGEGRIAVEQWEKAVRLNPLHEPWYYGYGVFVHFAARRPDEALRLAESSPAMVLTDSPAVLAAACGHLGLRDQARTYVAEFLDRFQRKVAADRELSPGEAFEYVLRANPYVRRADRAYLVAGLTAAGLEGAPAPEPHAPAAEPVGRDEGRFVRRGAVWEIDFAGRQAVAADSKGCGDLAVLLTAPGEQIHCLDLAGRLAEGDAGEAMDAKARAAVQRRIQDLQADIAEAERHNDFARTERLSEELDALIEQLAAAIGLGGRGRKLGDPAEKARTAVTWRIRSAIKRIAEAHPALGRHLEASIRTGAFCVYQPETPVRWAVS